MRIKTLATLLLSSLVVTNAEGQFTTVLNIPNPNPSIGAIGSIGSNTQLNLSDGGSIGFAFDAGNHNSENIEVNIMGGHVANAFDARSGSTINISGGYLGSITAYQGSQINISGGDVLGSLYARQGSEVNISGGEVIENYRWSLVVDEGSILNMTGGYVNTTIDIEGDFNMSGGKVNGWLEALADSHVTFSGGEISGFHARERTIIDISGGTIWSLSSAGEESQLSISGGFFRQYLNANGQVDISGGVFHDYFQTTGQVDISGGRFMREFQALEGSSINLLGGNYYLNGQLIEGMNEIGNTLALDLAEGDVLTGTLSSGSPFFFTPKKGDSFASGSLILESSEIPSLSPDAVTVSTGETLAYAREYQVVNVINEATLPVGFIAGRGSTVNLNGGSIGGSSASVASILNITGGEVGPLHEVYGESEINLRGGNIGFGMVIHDGASLEMSGGKIDMPVIHLGASIRAIGGNFYLNGEPVEGLGAVGSQLDIDWNEDDTLSGIYSDGTPFVFEATLENPLEMHSIQLEASEIPDLTHDVFTISTPTDREYIRRNQSLKLLSGGRLNQDFIAGNGSAVEIQGGITYGEVITVGSSLDMQSGRLESLKIRDSSSVNLSGGSVEGNIDLSKSTLNVYGAEINGELDVDREGVASLQSGTYGGLLKVSDGGTLTISGGQAQGTVVVTPGGELIIAGGSFDKDVVVLGGYAELQAGSTATFQGDINIREEGHLQVSSDFDSSVYLQSGGVLTTTSGRADSVYVEDGKVIASGGGINFLSLDAGNHVDITGGGVSKISGLYAGSILTMTGGYAGTDFIAYENSTVNVSGGRFGDDLEVRSGSTFNMTAGEIGDNSSIVNNDVIISNASIGSNFKIIDNSSVESVNSHYGDHLNVTDATLHLDEGSLGEGARVNNNSVVSLTGGVWVNKGVNVSAGGKFVFEGSKFYLNGEILDLSLLGDAEYGLNLQAGDILTGYGANGTPFYFSSNDGDSFAVGTLYLKKGMADLPSEESIILRAGDLAPQYSKVNQTVTANFNRPLPSNFVASPNSHILLNDTSTGSGLKVLEDALVEVLERGDIGSNSSVIGGRVIVNSNHAGIEENLKVSRKGVVNLVDGEIKEGWEVVDGGTLDIDGGELAANGVIDSAVIDLSEGVVGDGVAISNGSLAKISGGFLGNNVNVSGNSQVSLTGGSIGTRSNLTNSTLVATGGIIGRLFNVEEGGLLEIKGGAVDWQLSSAPNSSVTIDGGTVGDYFETSGNVKILAGTVGERFEVRDGGEVVIRGGEIGRYFTLYEGANVLLEDGEISRDAYVASGASLTISGGSVGVDVGTASGSNVVVQGAEYYLDGDSVQGLSEVGDSVGVNLQESSILSGVMSNGTPFYFGGFRNDSFADGSLNLSLADMTKFEEEILTPDIGEYLSKSRINQTINVGEGAGLRSGFLVGSDTTVNLNGGNISNSYTALSGSTTNINEGYAGYHFKAFAGSIVNLLGGRIAPEMDAYEGSLINIESGKLGSRFRAYAGSRVNISGGEISRDIMTETGSQVIIKGYGFRIDEQVVDDLTEAGDQVLLADISEADYFYGYYQNGTPFYFDDSTSFAEGSVTLELTDKPTLIPEVVTVDHTYDFSYVNSNQTMILTQGGSLPGSSFLAPGSTVKVNEGYISYSAFAMNSNIHVNGGSVYSSFKAIQSTNVIMSNGVINSSAELNNSSLLLLGGEVGTELKLINGSTAEVRGGTIDDRAELHSSSLEITNGHIGRYMSIIDSIVHMYGGQIDSGMSIGPGSQIHISGGQIDGMSIGSDSQAYLSGRFCRQLCISRK